MSQALPECFGRLFPDLDRVQANVTARGVAFTAHVEGWGMGAKTKRTTTDRERFVECTRCPAYQTCYDLSMAHLALTTAVESRF